MLINLIVEINGFTTCMHMSVYVPVCIHIIHTHTHTHRYTRIHAKSLQSCPTLCDSIDCSLPGIPVHGILE